jgi:hypothetical protein
MNVVIAKTLNKAKSHGLCYVALVLVLVCVGAMPSSPAPTISQDNLLSAIRLNLQADRRTISMTDRLRVTLSVEAPTAVDVSLPQVESPLGPFTVLRQEAAAPTSTAPGIQVWRKVYELEAEHSGTLTIPTLTVKVAQRPDGAAPGLTLQTDPLPITVTTLLTEDADVRAPKDIAPPVALPRRGLQPWMWVALGAALGFSALAALWWWRRRRKARATAEPQRQLAHVLALQALQDLMQSGLLQEATAERFYVRLSDIVRHYVEWRFGLQATEQTTEEFLVAVHQTGGLIGSHQALLGTFLEHCDLVKFARHRPSQADMQGVYDSATEFVQRTATEDAWVEMSVAGVEV